MSSERPAIGVHNLSKRYTIRHNADTPLTLAELAVDRIRHPFSRAPREHFLALRDVSFDVHQGEVVGIVGRNGAGKSTLLRCLTRVTDPTSGRIDLWGRIGSLLEVGTGFHPELTGRENVYLNGSILGMRRNEIRRQFDDIVEFAGVEKFLDTPVKRYSSGMYVRLAFAVAAHLESEILLIDEVLAVGDADFQQKCLGKLSELASGGRTVLLVSHSAQVIRQVASRALLLAAGSLEADGTSAEVLQLYASDHCDLATYREVTSMKRFEPGLGTRVRAHSVQLTAPTGSYESDEPISCILRFQAYEAFASVTLSMSIHTIEGIKLGSCFATDTLVFDRSQACFVKVSMPPTSLAAGRYCLSFGLSLGDQSGNTTFLDMVHNAIEFEIRPGIDRSGLVERWDASWGPIRFGAASASSVSPCEISEHEITSDILQTDPSTPS